MVIRTFGGHLLREGFRTSAAAKGAGAFKMCDISRHRSMNTLQGYVRDAIGPTFQVAGQAIPKRPMSAMGHWADLADFPFRSGCT